MALARGVIAIGEAAVGLVAIGGFAGGGVTIAGMSLGVISLSGLSVGLFLAMGGIAFGGFAVGSLAFGAVGAVGVLPLTMLDPSAETMQWLSLAAWGLSTAVVTAGVVGLVISLGDAAEPNAGE